MPLHTQPARPLQARDDASALPRRPRPGEPGQAAGAAGRYVTTWELGAHRLPQARFPTCTRLGIRLGSDMLFYTRHRAGCANLAFCRWGRRQSRPPSPTLVRVGRLGRAARSCYLQPAASAEQHTFAKSAQDRRSSARRLGIVSRISTCLQKRHGMLPREAAEMPFPGSGRLALCGTQAATRVFSSGRCLPPVPRRPLPRSSAVSMPINKAEIPLFSSSHPTTTSLVHSKQHRVTPAARLIHSLYVSPFPAHSHTVDMPPLCSGRLTTASQQAGPLGRLAEHFSVRQSAITACEHPR